MTRRLTILAAALLAAAPQTLVSRDAVYRDVDSLAVARQIDMDSIVVSAKYVKDVVPAQVLTGRELERLNSHSVSDALRYFSGVQIKDYGGIGGLKTVNVRSMGSQHVGVFFDGIQLGNAQNGTVDLGRFSLDNMESVALYNGQKSNLFQSAKDFASASSIYFTTRTPEFAPGKNHNLKATVKTGSFGLANPSVVWDRKIGERLSSSLSGEYLYTTGKYKFTYRKKEGYDTTDTRRNGDVAALRLEHGLFGSFRGGSWKTKVYFYGSERGYPGAYVKEGEGTSAFTHQDRQWDRNFFVQGSVRKAPSSRYRWMASGKYAWDYLRYLSDPEKDPSVIVLTDNRFRQQEIYGSLVNYVRIFKFWEAGRSTDYQFNTLSANLTDFAYPRRHTALATVSTQLQFKRLEIQASLLGTLVHDKTSAGKPAPDKKRLTPTAVASFQPFLSEQFYIRAFYKKIFRLPTFNDLYYTFIGNSSLKPENSTQYNIGLSYTVWFGGCVSAIDLQADGYYNEVSDKIVAIPTSNQFRWTMLNLGYVEIRGVDVALEADWAPADKLFLVTRLTYTYQKAQDFTDPDDAFYGGQIPYAPWNSYSAVAGATYGRWELNYSFIYTGKRYSSRANTPENRVLEWFTHDISLGYTLPVKERLLRATVEVNNLLNQRYEVVSRYPMPGTNLKAILSVQF
ncbi:MAG: TonB-dependent receptor [Alistipes sp.]|nr:TonB-dependent receptor [Alistipes sp.]